SFHAFTTPPQPAQRFGQDSATVLAGVALGAEVELVIVALELQRQGHLLVRQRPVAMFVVEVLRPRLQEDANRLLRRLANLAWVDVAAADIREAADMRQHLAEHLRPLPGHGERADAAAADPADRPAVGV